jgi:hypothetical protein
MLIEALSGAFVSRVAGVPLASTWANLLRLVPAAGVRAKALPALAGLSRRAMKSVVHASARRGLVLVEGEIVRLTDAGRRVRPANALETGACAPLAALVSRLDLEHPHHVTPYGTADPSMTGGPGVDWKPVPRRQPSDTAALPMASLLSQALTAFAIEYEEARAGPIMWGANILRRIGDDGADRASLPGAGTNGVPNLQRLGVVEAGASEVVRLTTRGRAMRDAFEPLSSRIEARWRARHGGELVDSVIDAVAVAGDDLPAFPVVVWTGAEFAVSPNRPARASARLRRAGDTGA